MNSYKEFFSRVFLFSSLPIDKLESAISECEPELRVYQRHEMIYTPENYEKEIGFIFSGECEIIRKNNDGSDVVLNKLKPGNSFGILAVPLPRWGRQVITTGRCWFFRYKKNSRRIERCGGLILPFSL